MKVSSLSGIGINGPGPPGANLMAGQGPPVGPAMQPPQDPGAGGQAYYGPPGQKPESSGWKYVLTGCVALVIIGVLVLGGGGVLCYYKGTDIMTEMLNQSKTEIMGQLTPDHTEEQEQRFSRAYDAFVADMEDSGFMQWIQQRESLFRDFQSITADRQITVEESQDWASRVEEQIGVSEQTEE